MIAFFSTLTSLAFLNPWVLSALIALPALWLLLRVMPPAPKRIYFPAAQFLHGLQPKSSTPATTPWWILILRIAILTLIITACAQAILNPSRSDLITNKPIHIIIENDWSSAHLWDQKIQTAQTLLTQAQRKNIPVGIQTTTAQSGQATSNSEIFQPVLTAGEAIAALKPLTPNPWNTLPASYADNLKSIPPDASIIMLSSGIKTRALDATLTQLKNRDFTIITPRDTGLPLALKRDHDQQNTLSFRVIAPSNTPSGKTITLKAYNARGQVIGFEDLSINTGQTPSANTITFDLPETIARNITRIAIDGHNSAGATYLLPSAPTRKPVGIVTSGQDAAQKPLIESQFYLTRALSPYATIQTGDLGEMLNADISMLILPDIASFSPQQLDNLETWIKKGGLLLRFAGPNMEQAQQNFLTPVTLRRGGRSTQGTLSWENSPILARFNDNTPLAGLQIPQKEDITIRQQILAQPDAALADKTWASLSDGTPLVTATALDAGQIIMIHTTADPSWSNLPLSGAYVQILKRIVNLAGNPPPIITTNNDAQTNALTSTSTQQNTVTLSATKILNGFGHVTAPSNNVKRLTLKTFAAIAPSPVHPPGIYTPIALSNGGANTINNAEQYILNIGDFVTQLRPIPPLRTGITRTTYSRSDEINLAPMLFTLALILFLIDWIIMTAMRSTKITEHITKHMTGALKRISLPAFIAIFALSAIMPNISAHAQTLQAPDQAKYADGLYLGFIKSANPTLNTQTRAGLEGLRTALTQRTSAAPLGIAALNPETDPLTFFPLLYWAIDPADPPLSDTALHNLQSYLDHGGTILFDTREPTTNSHPTSTTAIARTTNASHLQTMIAGLNIPALTPIAKDHVLGKSFYLLDTFPGRYNGGTLWVENNSIKGRDGVSSVIIGSHDWASAWSAYSAQNVFIPRGSRNDELAIRFGINLMMYALTGNYKADQIHVQHILERIGE